MNTAVIQRGGDFKAVPQTVQKLDDLDAPASLVLLVKHVADKLERHYPGWMWTVAPDEFGGVINIASLRISASQVYTLHTANVQNDPGMRRVLKAGGEYLERFGFKRGRYSLEEWQRRERVMGRFKADVSDMQARVRKSMAAHDVRAALQTGHARITTDSSVGAALRETKAL